MVHWVFIRFALLLAALMASSTIHASEAMNPVMLECTERTAEHGEPNQQDSDRPGVHHHGGCHSPAANLIDRYFRRTNLYALEQPFAHLGAQPTYRWSAGPGLRPPIA